VRRKEPLPDFVVKTGATWLADREFSHEREARLWAVSWEGFDAIVRCLDPQRRLPPGEEAVLASKRWIHTYLAALAETGLPTPRPLPMFDGHSVAVVDGAVWEALSYSPGVSIAWSERPGMYEVGAFLAEFHEKNQHVTVAGQCPGSTPLADVPRVLLDTPWNDLTDDQESIDRLMTLVDAFERESHELGFGQLMWGPIHGDCTTMNVLRDGFPPRPSGLIDFGAAYVEIITADIAFGLWQSGRAAIHGRVLDPGQVRAPGRRVRLGRALPDDAVRGIPVCIVGRGLQMIAKRVPLGIAHLNDLDRIEWVFDHLGTLEGLIAGIG
jgi:hypothetical protein